MKMTFKALAAMCAVMMSMTGCTIDSGTSSGDVSQLVNNTNSQPSSVGGIVPAEEAEIIKNATCKIEFSDEEIKIEGSGAKLDGNVVTISDAGVYSLSGKCSDAKILITADKQDVKLLFNGVELSSKSGAVIDCEDAKLLTLCIAGNTENTISDSVNYTFEEGEDEPDAAIFSRSDTVVSGSGELVVNGLYKDALKCKDGLTIGSGTLVLNAADDGITGKDYTVVYGGNITVVSGGDGIKSTNDTDENLGYVTITDGTINIESGKDGIQAETLLTVIGGNITIKAGGDAADEEIAYSGDDFGGGFGGGDFGGFMKGDKSQWDMADGEKPTAPDGTSFPDDVSFPDGTTPPEMPEGFDGDRRPDNMQQNESANTDSTDDSTSTKGLKAGGNIAISGGVFNVVSADDSIHSNSSITIDDGEFTLSSCDDGIHADVNLTINGGTINVTKSYEGLEGNTIDILGGKIDVKAVDDGLNASGGTAGMLGGFWNGGSDDCYISISCGEIVVDVESGDGIDSNGTVAQTGGSLTVYGPTNNNNSAIDYESSYALSGGYLVALGSQGMAQAPSTLSQPCISIYADVAAGSVIEVRDSSGSVIMSVTTPKACQSLIFSCDKMTAGSEYSIYSGDTLLKTVTATDGVAGEGASGNGFGGGHGGFNRQDFTGTETDGSITPDGTSRPEKPGRGTNN